MKKLFTILLILIICVTTTATAQIKNSIVLDRSTFRAVQKDALTGVNVDPIGVDHSRQACSRIKIKFDRMNRAHVDALTVKVVSNTDLTINKGDYVLITGISGIGKSTLLKLLLNVYNVNSGEIYLKLNDNSNVYIDKSLRNLFAYVPQGNFLLSGTIRENISFMRPDATDEEIMEVAKICCANEFIDHLPDGLDTKIGEKGIGLSEGQIQRIAIARAVICNNPILLLDEATSALDIETEKQLLKNLRNMRNITCILISHKESAYSVCNKNVVIENKKIIVSENVND